MILVTAANLKPGDLPNSHRSGNAITDVQTGAGLTKITYQSGHVSWLKPTARIWLTERGTT